MLAPYSTVILTTAPGGDLDEDFKRGCGWGSSTLILTGTLDALPCCAARRELQGLRSPLTSAASDGQWRA